MLFDGLSKSTYIGRSGNVTTKWRPLDIMKIANLIDNVNNSVYDTFNYT